jgi:hypothetical protein
VGLLLSIPYQILHAAAAFFAVTLQCSRQNKARKKQVAMIAQKIIDANQAHYQGRALITSS